MTSDHSEVIGRFLYVLIIKLNNMNKIQNIIIIGILIALSFSLGYFIKGLGESSTEVQELQNQITTLQNQNNQLQQQINEPQGTVGDDDSQNEDEIVDSNKCNVYPNASGNCPEGCVNYGAPFGCVTQEYYDECAKGGKLCPKCLSKNTVIDTPTGDIKVQELKTGMVVWTLNDNGQRVAQPILKVSVSLVSNNHRVVHIMLEDGRELWVSPGHPITDGRTVEKIKVGDLYDGSVVTHVILEQYIGDKTYDILPAGETGYYWANGILMGSTLKNR